MIRSDALRGKRAVNQEDHDPDNDPTLFWTTICTDRRCVLRADDDDGGMRTNGGCAHVKLRPREYVQAILAFRAQLVEMTADRDEARKDIAALREQRQVARFAAMVPPPGTAARVGKERDLALLELTELKRILCAARSLELSAEILEAKEDPATAALGRGLRDQLKTAKEQIDHLIGYDINSRGSRAPEKKSKINVMNCKCCDGEVPVSWRLSGLVSKCAKCGHEYRVWGDESYDDESDACNEWWALTEPDEPNPWAIPRKKTT